MPNHSLNYIILKWLFWDFTLYKKGIRSKQRVKYNKDYRAKHGVTKEKRKKPKHP